MLHINKSKIVPNNNDENDDINDMNNNINKICNYSHKNTQTSFADFRTKNEKRCYKILRCSLSLPNVKIAVKDDYPIHNINCDVMTHHSHPPYRPPLPPPPQTQTPLEFCCVLEKKLPYDILRKIYVDYFHIKHKYVKMINIITNISSRQLLYKSVIDLKPFVMDMLKNEDGEFLEYTLKHAGEKYYFKTVYNKFVLKNERAFKNIKCDYEALACNWLFYIYH